MAIVWERRWPATPSLLVKTFVLKTNDPRDEREEYRCQKLRAFHRAKKLAICTNILHDFQQHFVSRSLGQICHGAKEEMQCKRTGREPWNVENDADSRNVSAKCTPH